MDAGKRKALESAGWRFGDAADFLKMDEAERQQLDAQSRTAMVVRPEDRVDKKPVERKKGEA